MVYTVTYKYNLGPTPITIVPINANNDPNQLFYISFEFYNKIYM